MPVDIYLDTIVDVKRMHANSSQSSGYEALKVERSLGTSKENNLPQHEQLPLQQTRDPSNINAAVLNS